MIEVYLVDENRGNCLRYPSIPNYPVTVWVKFIRIGYKQLPKGLVYVFRTIWKYKKKKTLVWVTGISLFSIFNRMGPARAGVIKDWFREYFKVFTKLPESRSDQGNLETLKILVKLQAITCDYKRLLVYQIPGKIIEGILLTRDGRLFNAATSENQLNGPINLMNILYSKCSKIDTFSFCFKTFNSVNRCCQQKNGD